MDIYGDSRFPNNDGFDPESCINVTLINSRIDVADDGICPKVMKAKNKIVVELSVLTECYSFLFTHIAVNYFFFTKASAGGGPLQGLYVHNVSIRSPSHAIKFGSNTGG